MKFRYTEELIKRMPELASAEEGIKAAICAIIECHNNGGKLLIAGCGGSASDSEHISGELLKGFLLKREPRGAALKALTEAIGEEEAKQLQGGVRAIPLISLSAVSTAYANDVNPELVFAQGVYALGLPCDIFLGLSTSGNSKSVVKAARVADAIGMKTVALTGESGGALAELCHITVKAPHRETFRVQEYHLPIYHAICADVESELFGDLQ